MDVARASRIANALLLAVALISCKGPGGDPPPATGTPLGVRDSPELGRYLTDAAGRPVYVSHADRGPASMCNDACAAEWPAVPGAGKPVESAEPAIQQNLVGSTRRSDGGVQLTYAGHPLYYKRERPAEQLAPSLTDQWGTWSLVFPHGEPMVLPP